MQQNIFDASYSKRIRKYMKSCSEEISETNLSMQYQMIICISVIYIVLLTAAILLLNDFNLHPVYFGMIPILLVFGIIAHVLRNSSKVNSKLIRRECIAFYILLMVEVILTDVIPYRESKSSLIPMVMITFSALYIDYYYVYVFVDLSLLVAYSILVFFWKIPEIAYSDIFDGFSAFIISMVMAYIVLGIRAKQGKITTDLREKSNTDYLTGLLNKEACETTVSEYITRKSPDNICALILIDIDNFKSVNEKLGHNVGDEFLAHVGRILRHTFRTNDIIGRIGGDEFMILVRRIPGNEDILSKRCDQILAAISDYKVEKGWNFSCSIGVTVDKGRHSYEQLVRLTDDALTLAKIRGKDCYVKWNADDKKYEKDTKVLLISSNNTGDAESMIKLFKYDYDDIIVADNANDSLNLLSQHVDNITGIILTLEKSETDNIDMLKFIKHRSAYAHINVVVVTNDNAINLEAVKMGAIGAFSKPFREENLKKLIG